MSSLIGFDTETHLFEAQRLLVPIVCVSASCGDHQEIRTRQTARDLVEYLIRDPEYHVVAHYAGFDLAQIMYNWPNLIPDVFALAASGRAHCTVIREKLLNLTNTGNIKDIPLPDGSMKKNYSYSLQALVQKYLGIDLSEDKKREDAWRLHYVELDGTPLDQWPHEAVEYAVADAVYAERIFWEQERHRQSFLEQTGIDPFAVANFRVAADLALYLCSQWGMKVDAQQQARVMEQVKSAIDPANLPDLIEVGILMPAEPPRPHARGHKDHVEGCKRRGCDCPVRMVPGREEKINDKVLRAYVEHFCTENGLPVKRTDPTEKFPEGQVCVDAEWFDDHAHLDPVLEQYRTRQKVQKIVTTELPRMLDAEGSPAPVVHPVYDVLKRTGRTSSYAVDTYPSFNCQNVDPRVRECYEARPGYVLFSLDYGAMELGTLAQKCLDLFGFSVLADKINAGVDPHAYLGGQLAYALDHRFNEVCVESQLGTQDAIFEAFLSLKDSPHEEIQALFKHYRTFAKPTGLGYPGGLGPDTFVAYAKATYGVIVESVELAASLRDVWLQTYPEMPQYFDWLKERCVDPRHAGKFAYFTPYGMYRPNCDFTQIANGIGLQSPSAEGAITAVINLVQACYDPSLGSILYDDDQGPVCRPICFIHDEIVGELREDDMMHERCQEISRIMVESMRTITPQVEPRTSAALMRRWNKKAEAVYDGNGRLTIWEPHEQQDQEEAPQQQEPTAVAV